MDMKPFILARKKARPVRVGAFGALFLLGIMLGGRMVGALTAPVRAEQSQAVATSTTMSKATARSIYLVIEDNLLASIAGKIPADFQVVPKSKLDAARILDAVAAGDSLVWIGEGSEIPKDLWVGTFQPAAAALSVSPAEDSPVHWKSLAFRKVQLSSAYIKPVKELPFHNVDEEPRADFLPLLEARDRFGQVVGYPGVLMHYYAASTVRHRFAGSECFFFLFDRPAEALDVAGWEQLLNQVATRFRAHLQLKRVTTDYASYRLGERVLIRAQIANWRPQAAATEIHFYAQAPGGKEFHEIVRQRRCPDGSSESEAVADFIPQGHAGLWTIRVEARQDPVHAEELAIEGRPVLVDRRDIGIVVLDGELKTPSILSLNGPSIRLEGQDAFWAGTSYYPSSSWWDWLWRDFRPLEVASDLAAMRRTGYCLVRIWIDPVLDEQSLRAMDAAIYLAAQNGIVLDVMVFSYWVRTYGFDRQAGEHVSFVFRPFGRDFNVHGVSLRDMAMQREYIQVLAKRWRGAGNIFYDLSNETYIKDPDPTQMDKEVQAWEGIPKENGILRDTLLFRRWAKEMTTAIRQAEADQPVTPGYMYSLYGGGDQYLADRDGEIESWHAYDPERTGLSLSYVDPACSHRPVLLEEFGTDRWNDEKFYDGTAHYALLAGAAGAMSYEWGIRWLARDLGFVPTPLREAVGVQPDPRWFTPDLEMANAWPARAGGIAAIPSGFHWGSIYHGTPFPAGAAVALGRLGLMGGGLARALRPEKVYVVVPTAFNGARDGMDEVTNVVNKLWQEKAVFGMLQEDCLGTLPKTTRLLICPKGVTAASEGKLAELRRSGVEVFTGADDGWRKSAQLPHLSVTPGEGTNLLVRRTVQGTLYGLLNRVPVKAVTLKTERGTPVRMGLSDYVLVQEGEAGINWVEASGEVVVQGSPFCAIDRGRAILASDDGLDLVHSKRVRVLATEPTRIKFSRAIASVAVLEEGRRDALATFEPEAADNFSLDIDSELIRYVLRIELQAK
jgi:hypothetical protein